MAYRGIIESSLEHGFISEEEAARRVKIANDAAHQFFIDHGLRPLIIPLGKNGRSIRRWVEKDVDALVEKKKPSEPLLVLDTPTKENKPVGGETNGGKIMKALANIRTTLADNQDELAELEARIARLERLQ